MSWCQSFFLVLFAVLGRGPIEVSESVCGDFRGLRLCRFWLIRASTHQPVAPVRASGTHPAERKTTLARLLVNSADRLSEGYTFIVPEGRHRPALAQLAKGWIKGFYGVSTARVLRWRVTFHRPSDPTGIGGKVCGKTRALGWPFRRMRYGRLDEIAKPAHEESDRFTFNMGRDSVALRIYAYREGRRPYDDSLRYADQSQLLQRVAYEQPYVLSMKLKAERTDYFVHSEAGAELAHGSVEHRGVTGWQIGKLQGLYIGGKEPAPRPVRVTMNRLD